MSLFVREQILQHYRLIDDTCVLTFGYAHRCHHHQLDAVRLVVHLACSESRIYVAELLMYLLIGKEYTVENLV